MDFRHTLFEWRTIGMLQREPILVETMLKHERTKRVTESVEGGISWCVKIPQDASVKRKECTSVFYKREEIRLVAYFVCLFVGVRVAALCYLLCSYEIV